MLKNEKKRKMEQNYKVFLLEAKNKYFSFMDYSKNVTMVRVNLIDEIICGTRSITFVRGNYKYVYVTAENEEPIYVYNKVIDFLTAKGEGIFEIKKACKY